MGTSARTEPAVTSFLRWTIEQAKQAIALAADTLEAIRVNRAFIDGDHWQSGDGWIGPWPTIVESGSDADATNVTLLQGEIEKAFTSRNALGEVVDRHVGGVVGREPRWTFVPRELRRDDELSDAQTTARDELEALVTEWWDDFGAHEIMQAAARGMLYSDDAGVALRIFIPAGLLAPAGNGTRAARVPQGDIAAALKLIRVETVDPDVGRVIAEELTGIDVGVVVFKDETTSRESVEITYVDEGGRTHLLAIAPPVNVGENDRTDVAFDLGGRLLMAQLARKPFISEQARQSQLALNYANTMIVRNVTTGGFLEQVLLNAKLPGHWSEVDGVRKYVSDPIVRGPNTVNSFVGVETEAADGSRQVASPSVLWREPVKPDASISAKREHYEDMLNECDQAHVLIAGDAVASAVSRQQARADYRTSLQISEAPLNRAGRWMLETVLAYAEALAGAPGQWSRDWRASFACIIDTGPLTPEEITAIQGMAEKRLIASGTARELVGVADPDAEQERVDTEDGVDLARELQRAQIYKAWVDAGVAEGPAAERAGLSEEEVAALMVGFEEPEPTPAPGAPGRPAPAPVPTPAGGNGNAGNAGNGAGA